MTHTSTISNIPYLDLKRITEMHLDELTQAVNDVVRSGWYLQGEATRRFENNYARYIGTRHCVGVANGLDSHPHSACTHRTRAHKAQRRGHSASQHVSRHSSRRNRKWTQACVRRRGRKDAVHDTRGHPALPQRQNTSHHARPHLWTMLMQQSSAVLLPQKSAHDNRGQCSSSRMPILEQQR